MNLPDYAYMFKGKATMIDYVSMATTSNTIQPIILKIDIIINSFQKTNRQFYWKKILQHCCCCHWYIIIIFIFA